VWNFGGESAARMSTAAEDARSEMDEVLRTRLIRAAWLTVFAGLRTHSSGEGEERSGAKGGGGEIRNIRNSEGSGIGGGQLNNMAGGYRWYASVHGT